MKKSQLVLHEMAAHAKENTSANATKPKYTCKECNKQFTRRSSLTLHERNHNGYKPYKCKLCDKSFVQKSYLVDHEVIHTNEKPFTCTVCNKSYAQRASLAHHKKVHASPKLSCNYCDKSFDQKGNLNRHENNCYKRNTRSDYSYEGLPIKIEVKDILENQEN